MPKQKIYDFLREQNGTAGAIPFFGLWSMKATL